MNILYEVMLLVIVGFTGVLLGITPMLLKHSEVFAVTVPPVEFHSPELKSMRLRYCALTLAATAVALIVTAICLAISENAFFIAYTASTLALVVVSFALYLFFRSRVRALKEERGWAAQPGATVSAVITPASVKKPPSIWWNLLYVVIVAVTLVIGIVYYPHMPAMVPMNTDLAGKVIRYAPKSFGVLLFAPMIQVFFGVIMTFVFWMIGRARRDIDPAHPLTTAEHSALFTRVQSIFMLVFGLALAGSMIAMQFSMAGKLSINVAGLIIIVVTVVLMAALVWISLKYGQSGARLGHPAQDSDEVARDDDRYWKLGVLYFNPDDPALFVPKRFGVGWTNNFARPMTWVLAGGLVVLCVGLVWATRLLGQ
ncbi:MAG: DUF5808 domain-containing protein [Coriobacteriia bacterium]|nr:DUF5808 domain-containing protein [Coriobacteriia bacterium]